MAWEDAARKRKQAEQPLRCSICLILIGEGHIEQAAYPSSQGMVCSLCLEQIEADPIRIDTAEKDWQGKIKQWRNQSSIKSQLPMVAPW